MSPSVSSRGTRMPASPIRKLMPLADDAVRRGVRVLHLNIGQPDIETPAPMLDRLRQHTAKVLAYSPSAGTPEFLLAMQDYYARLGLDVALDQIITTTGGSEAILLSMFATLDPGDEVMLPEPFYTNYATFATMAGASLVPLRTFGENGFHLPRREEWEKALTSRCRAVLLCNPNNPTGTVYTAEEMQMAARFCRDHDLFLIVDEVYREFVYDGRESGSALSLAEAEDLVIVVDSLSKRFSACGIRLGCLVTRNRDVYQACLRMAQGRLFSPGLAQMIAVGITEIGPEYSEAVAREYQSRRDLLFAGLTKIPGVFLRQPEGAFYFIARLPITDSEDFAAWLLREFAHEGETVMVAPAPGFYATPGLGTSEVRIAYVLNRQALARAVALLARGLEQYCASRGIEAPVEAPAADP